MSNAFSILLVNPIISQYVKNKEPKLSPAILYLAGSLKRQKEYVEVLDLNIFDPWSKGTESPEDACGPIIIEKIKRVRPNLIGFSCLFSGQFQSVLKMARIVKSHFKEVKIVIGGMHPTMFAREILTHCHDIDYVVLGEGEIPLAELVGCLRNGTSLDSVTGGIAFRHAGNITLLPQHFIDNIDGVPSPAYDLVDFNQYKCDLSRWNNPKGLRFNMTVPIVSSRSCPLRCSFCNMFLVMGNTFRARSPESVVDEIELLYHEYGMNHFNFVDDNFAFHKKRAIEICNLIKIRNLNIQFETMNGLMIGRLDEDIMDAMADAGWVRSAFAVESGSDYIRNKVMGKALKREKIFEIFKLTRKYPQVFTRAFFVFGMPEDTHETLMESYEMMRTLDVDEINCGNLTPLSRNKSV